MAARSRRVAAACLLVIATGGVTVAAAMTRHLPDRATALNRVGYRQYLARHGATVVRTDSASLQQTLNDCGVAVVREALRTIGIASIPSHDSVARLAHLTAVGATLANLARAIDLSGAHATFGPTNVLGSHLLVAHLSMGHFVLVREISNDEVRFFDPMVGEVVASVSAFRSLWSGHGFTVTASEVAPTRQIAPHIRGAMVSQPE